MKLARLFEPLSRPSSLASELDEIRDGKKTLGFYASERSVVEDGSDLIPVMRGAFQRGLAVSLVPRGTRVDIFVLHPQQSWRIPAFEAFVASTVQWSWDAEEQQGVLLGYSAAQRARHIAHLRESRIGFGFLTVYAVMPATQVTPALDATTVFFPREPARITPRVLAQLPRATRVVRVGIASSAVSRLFGDARQWGRIIEKKLDRRSATHLANAMVTPVEVLGRRCWATA